jgi:SagB-type dehydrogenase family enzyme
MPGLCEAARRPSDAAREPLTLPPDIARAVEEAKSAAPVHVLGEPPSWRPAPDGPALPLGPLVSNDSQRFTTVLSHRRSERVMRAPDLGQLATVLVRSGRVRDVAPAPDGYAMSHRPTPSAGGRHPADMYVLARDVDGLDAGVWLFDPLACSLAPSARQPGATLRRLGKIAETDLPPAAILVVARLERTLSRYPAGLSLVWRDVGALLATLHLCATDLGLASCIVGSCGVFIDDPVDGALDMGALLVGKRVDDDART